MICYGAKHIKQIFVGYQIYQDGRVHYSNWRFSRSIGSWLKTWSGNTRTDTTDFSSFIADALGDKNSVCRRSVGWQVDQVRGEGGLWRPLVEASRVDSAAARHHDAAQLHRRLQLRRLHGPARRRRHHHQTSRRYTRQPRRVATAHLLMLVNQSINQSVSQSVIELLEIE